MRLLALIFTLSLFLNCYSNKFELKGRLENASDVSFVKITYDIITNERIRQIVHDSLPIDNGTFFLNGEIVGLTQAAIEINHQKFRFYYLKVDGRSPYKMKLSGTSVDDEFRELQMSMLQYDSILTEKFQTAANHIYVSEYDKDFDEDYLVFCHIKKQKLLNFCRSHIHFKIIPDLLLQALEIDGVPTLVKSNNQPYNKVKMIKKLMSKLPAETANTCIGTRLKNELRLIETILNCEKHPIGSEAPSFTSMTSTGDSITLSDYRGQKYVLLHFWGDSCCEGDESVIQVQNMTRDIPQQEIVHICISEFCGGEEWRDKIQLCKEDRIHIEENIYTDLYHLFWKHISSMYPISLLSAYVLIDKDGKIMAILQDMKEKDYCEL